MKAYLDEAKNFTYAEPFDKAFRLSDFDEALAMYPLSVKTVGEAGPEGKAYSLFLFSCKAEYKLYFVGRIDIYCTDNIE